MIFPGIGPGRGDAGHCLVESIGHNATAALDEADAAPA
jgi:hypothetical protein